MLHNLGQKIQGAIHPTQQTGPCVCPAGVTSYIDAINQKNVAGMQLLFEQNAVLHGCKINGTDLNGVNAILEHEQAFLTAFPDAKVTPVLCCTDPTGYTTVRSTFSGTHRGVFPSGNIAPTNKFVNNLFATTIFKLNAQGKIAEMWMSQDHLGLLQQLGVIALPQGLASQQASGTTSSGVSTTTTTQQQGMGQGVGGYQQPTGVQANM